MARLTLNAFAGFLTALLLAQQPVRNLSQLWPTASAGIAAADRIFDAIDARPAIVNRPGAQAADRPKAARCSFRDVSFAYHADAGADPGGRDPGHSGRQKDRAGRAVRRRQEHDLQSAAALLRHRTAAPSPSTARTFKASPWNRLRAAIALVTQEAILFDESIADNIALGKPGALPRRDRGRGAQRRGARLHHGDAARL